MKYKTFKGVAEQKDLGWFISCDVIDPYAQVPRMLPILKMQLFDFELVEGSQYQYELHLLQGNYVALLFSESSDGHVVDTNEMISSLEWGGEVTQGSKANDDHVPDVRKMVDVSDNDIEEFISSFPYTKHLDDGQYNDGVIVGLELGIEWYREQLKQRP